MMPSTAIIIPARRASTRLPDKPLLEIGGLPMICHVVNRALEADLGSVIVATDDEEIAKAVNDHGAVAVMTRADHASGSDRINEAAAILEQESALDFIVNLQGDLPFIRPDYIKNVLLALTQSEADISTLVAEIKDEAERDDSNVVKAILSPQADGHYKALYFSRATAPSGDGPLYHHIGIYAYRRAALADFVALPPSPLEIRERLEQLRALEAGMRIDAALVDTAPVGVDTPADLEQARRAFAAISAS